MLYPAVVANPLIVNDTPFTLQAKDGNGNVVQTIPPAESITLADNTVLPKPVALVNGVVKLVTPKLGKAVNITWIDHYRQSRDGGHGASLPVDIGEEYIIPDPTKWRVISLAITTRIIAANSMIYRIAGTNKWMPGGQWYLDFAITRDNASHLVDFRFYTNQKEPSTKYSTIDNCPTMLAAENDLPNSPICRVMIDPTSLSKINNTRDQLGEWFVHYVN